MEVEGIEVDKKEMKTIGETDLALERFVLGQLGLRG